MTRNSGFSITNLNLIRRDILEPSGQGDLKVQINYKENFGTKRDVILFSLSLMLLYSIQKDLKILSTLTTLEASAKSSVRSPGQACYHLILLFHSVGIRIGRHLGPNSTLSRFDHIDTRILLSFDKYIKYLYNLH